MGRAHITKPVTGHTALNLGQFSQWHETPLRELGMRPVTAAEQEDQGLRELHNTGAVYRVPFSRVRAGQEVVNTGKVAHFLDHPDNSPAKGVILPATGEVMLTDGHHRAAARMLRGRKTLQVEL